MRSRLYCESNEDQFTDVQLFLRNGVKGVMGDEDLMRDYALYDADNIYKGFIRRSIQGLIDRGLVEENEVTNEDGSHTLYFKKTD